MKLLLVNMVGQNAGHHRLRGQGFAVRTGGLKGSTMRTRYYVKYDEEDDWTEVSIERFIRAEKQAGFHSKYGPDMVATGGFHGNGIRGKVSYINVEESAD